MKDLAKYLRCSISPMVNCPLDCPYFTMEEVKEGIPAKADMVIDGIGYWTGCDFEKISEDAADYIEQLENGSKGTGVIVVNAEYFKELKKDLRGYMEKEKKYRWHDLRKDPDDLPEDNHNVLICLEGFEGYPVGVDVAIHNKFAHKWGTSLMSYKDDEVIAWREIEPFEEVE